MSDTIAIPAPALKLRTWCYVMSPQAYEISACPCGNHKTQWSEYEKHLWCSKCEKDFIPEFNGIFDGPIPVMTAKMMGITFDRFNLATQKRERFDVEKCAYIDEAGVVVEDLHGDSPEPSESEAA